MWLRVIVLIFTLVMPRAGMSDTHTVVYTFDYPPFTILSSRDGIVDRELQDLFDTGGISFEVAYLPVARALSVFAGDKKGLFAGNIGQFPDKVKSDLGYHVLKVVEIVAMVRSGNEDQSLQGARFIGLRGDKNMVRIASSFGGSIYEVDSNRQAAEMIVHRRADVFICVVEECETLPDYSKLARNINFNEKLELQLVYHKESTVADIIERLVNGH